MAESLEQRQLMAVMLNGTNQFIDADAPAQTPTSLTAEAWILFDGGLNAGTQVVIAGESNSSFRLMALPDDQGYPHLAFRANPAAPPVVSARFLSIAKYTHVAVTYSPSLGTSLYIDGVLDAQLTSTTPIGTFGESIAIGATYVGRHPMDPCSRFTVGSPRRASGPKHVPARRFVAPCMNPCANGCPALSPVGPSWMIFTTKFPISPHPVSMGQV